jgi:hypothetical protein
VPVDGLGTTVMMDFSLTFSFTPPKKKRVTTMQVLQSRRAAGLVKDDVKERIERNPIELPDVTCSASSAVQVRGI